jgi:hypothetical protein
MPPALHHEAHGVFMAKSRTGDVGVADVVVYRVGALYDGGDAALRPAGGAIEELVFCDKRNLAMRSQMEGGGHAGQTTADDDNVVIIQREMCTMRKRAGMIRMGKALQREELFSYAPIYQPYSGNARQRNEIFELYNTRGQEAVRGTGPAGWFHGRCPYN